MSNFDQALPPSLTLPRKGGGNATEQAATFDANRADGRVAFSVGVEAGRTRRRRVREKGSLRVRFPNAAPDALEAVFVNTAGGIAGGDHFEIDIAVKAGASLVAGTAAAEKIYRSLGTDANIALKLNVGAGARLAWLPQETILFDRARVTRRIDIDLEPDASLVMAEGIVFGRSAMGEVVTQGALHDRWRVRRGGKLVFAETTRLDGAVAEKLSQPAVTNGSVAIATLLIAPGVETQLEAVRALETEFRGEVGISAWNGLAVGRLCAKDGAALRHDIALILAALNIPLPRLWTQ